MKFIQTAKRYGAKVVAGGVVTMPLFAFATGSGNPVLDSVDFTTVAAWVGGIGIVIVGIAMAFKGIGLGKRAVAKV